MSQNILLIKRVAVLLLLVYVGFGAILFLFQDRYIYYPGESTFENCPSFRDAEQISFGSARGYLTRRSPEKVIVYYHGNAGSACDRNYLDAAFGTLGYATLFVEYSGYGETGKRPSMQSILQNVTDTIAFLKTQAYTEIIVGGESIGAGPAAYHALHGSVSDLVLITPYTNLAEVASSHYPFYPMRLLLRNNFTPDAWLADYNGPVSIIIAEHDEIIPNELSKKLYGEIPSLTKKVYTVKDVGHNTIYEKEELYTLLQSILK